MKHKPARRNVLLTYDSDYSSSRRIVSGALRRISEMSDWDVTTLNFRNRGFLRSVRLLAERQPFDGVITDSDIPRAEGLDGTLPHAIFVNAAATPRWTRFGCIPDNAAVAKAAADTLLRLRLPHFAYIGARAHDLEDSHSVLRERSFRKILTREGFKISTLFVDDPAFTQLLAELPKPVGIFAYNDVTAAKVLSVLHATGIAVPEQAAVVGVDNDPDICENTHPPLSSVALDFETAGKLAVEILAAALDGRRQIPHSTFGVLDAAERGSTQSGRTGSRIILAARDILRREYSKKLSLDSIARRLNVSPRLLTLRFREITGRSVHEELQEIRLSAAHKMLMSRTRPVKEIAAACGFPTLENFYRRYRQRFGRTPRG